MQKLIVSLTAGLVLALAGTVAGGGAQAAVVVPDGLRTAADQVAAVEDVQFVWRGRRFCWYDAGWRGPGWYWCGYRWRRGLGWGGPVGWRGWRRPGLRPGGRPSHRPGVRPPHRPGIRPPIGHVPGGRPGAHRPGGRPGGTSAGSNRPSGGTGTGGNRGRGGGGGRGGSRGSGRR